MIWYVVHSLLLYHSLDVYLYFFFSSRRRHTRCALVTGVQTCALPISFSDDKPRRCFAISEPDRAISPADPQWRPYFSISHWPDKKISSQVHFRLSKPRRPGKPLRLTVGNKRRSEEHTSELQSLMSNSSAVFCLKKKTTKILNKHHRE